MERTYTPGELAERYRTTPNTLKFWRHRQHGPRWFVAGKRVLYRESDVIAWESQQVERQQPTAS